jgi:hypothetical protein
MSDIANNIPAYGTPIIDGNGNISEVWWRFFTTLLARTGGTAGVDLGEIAVLIALFAKEITSLDAQGNARVPKLAPRQELPEGLAPRLIWQRENPLDRIPSHGNQNDAELHQAATQLLAGFMSATDKARLDAVVLPAVGPSSLIADVVTQNSTADGAILSLVMPANSMVAGTSLSFRLYGLISSAATSGTLSVWIKVGATKVMTQTFTLPALGQTNTGIIYTAGMTIRAAGAAAASQISSLMTSNLNALSGGPIVGSTAATINTTVANTLSIGWNWSQANASNIATAKNATILLEKP